MSVEVEASASLLRSDLKHASAYAERGMDRVGGWLVKRSARLIIAIADIQASLRERGGVCEIGVHHGKLFILLSNCLVGDERALAIDLFDNQAENTDESGRGDKEIFLKNVSRFSADPARVKTIEGNSLKLEPAELREAAAGDIRLFSVDGGHTAECAQNDVMLAQSVLSPSGVVILDDVFNDYFPGVVTGLSNYMADPQSELVPFLISPNKVFLTRPEAVERYRNGLRSMFPYAFEKQAEMFGRTVDVFWVSEKLSKVIGRFVKRHAGDGAFERIRSIKRRIRH